MNRVRATAGALLLVLAAAGASACSVNASPVDLATVASAQEPVPPGEVQGAAAVPKASGGAKCADPTASLRPGALPPPGAMPSGTTMAKIQARGYLIAGVDQNTYLFGYRNPATNNLEGFDIDMARDVAAAIFGSPDKVQFKAITSDQRVPELQSGGVDLVARTMTISCDRLSQVSFSTVYYEAHQRVLVDANSNVASLADLGGRKVCAAAGSDSLTHIAAVSQHPIPVSVSDWSDCLVMLQQGSVSAVSTDDTILAGMAAQDPNTKIVGPDVADEPYGIAVKHGDADFVRFVNGVLDNVRGNGAWASSYATWLQPHLGGGIPAAPPPSYSD
jgi:polar amino acid transport system substrate-binding protein